MPTDNLNLFPDNQNASTPAQQERDRIREEYRVRLAEKLKDPEFRKIEGFPIGTDEAILALSDPPHYTACPNPFLAEWLTDNAKPYDPATDAYHREPFAADVSEGKNDPIYNAHSYHTKVPHKAIMRYILHYTEPGDVVYDGFCGTGMTGVAAQMCGDKSQVESLGYHVDSEGNVWEPEAWKERSKQEGRNKGKQEGKIQESEGEEGADSLNGVSLSIPPPAFLRSGLPAQSLPFSKLGARKAILNDLSPAATFIAYNYNTPVDAAAFEREAKRILKEVEEECGWMYSTLHDATPEETERIAAAVRQCQTADELRQFYKELQSSKSPLRDPNSKLQVGRIKYTVWSDVLICPNCGAEIIFGETAINQNTGKVLDIFACSTCRSETSKRQCGRATITRFDSAINQAVTQSKQIPIQLNYVVGKQSSERSLSAYDTALVAKVCELPIYEWFPTDLMMGKAGKWGDLWRAGYHAGITHSHHFYTLRNLYVLAVLRAAANKSGLLNLHYWLNSIEHGVGKRVKHGDWSFPMSTMSGTLYLPALSRENNPLHFYATKYIKQASVLAQTHAQGNLTSTHSSTAGQMCADSCDYIFTDPPFGGNLPYSELNFLWEAWLRVKTNIKSEAITSDIEHKTLADYHGLMKKCFAAFHRILKPGHWMTVEFHNSANSVWNAIQESLTFSGFIVADVRLLDKESKTKKQATGTNAVNLDLVISCYKPRHEFEERFNQLQGKPEGVIAFLREHLAMLPVAPVNKAGRLETVAERTRFLLFDRMVAYHLQRGARIPLSAAEFYKLLEEQFVERDEMYFLNEQSARYDALKARGVETEQLSIFVRDEKTAVQWVRSRLTEQPQTLGDLTPKFMQELREWDSHEPRPELRDLLKEYFVEESGVWHVPDPNSEKDIESMRRNALLRLFREYANAKGPLKVFRKEAILEGFRHCWETQQYGVIVAVCEKIPEKILQEIQEFVMMYDVAKDLAPTMEPQTAFVWE